jgi:hypothetical protein
MKLFPVALLLASSSQESLVTADSALPGPAEVSPLLRGIAEWILTTNVQSNNITNHMDSLSESIFINGNLARVLLAAHTIFDNNATYLEAGLGWCDTLVKLQVRQATHDGRADAAGWWDTGYNELFIADTGTAVTALALCYDLTRADVASNTTAANTETGAVGSDTRDEQAHAGGDKVVVTAQRRRAPPQPERAAAYLDSMLRFADFVVNGTATTPLCKFSPGACIFLLLFAS